MPRARTGPRLSRPQAELCRPWPHRSIPQDSPENKRPDPGDATGNLSSCTEALQSSVAAAFLSRPCRHGNVPPRECRHPKHPEKTVTPAISVPCRARGRCSLSVLTSVRLVGGFRAGRPQPTAGKRFHSYRSVDGHFSVNIGDRPPPQKRLESISDERCEQKTRSLSVFEHGGRYFGVKRQSIDY